MNPNTTNQDGEKKKKKTPFDWRIKLALVTSRRRRRE